MSIVPLHQNPALDGGPLGWTGCNSTSTAMLIHFEKPSVSPSGGDVRACTVNADGSKDVHGGTTPSQNIDAAQRCWGVQLDGRTMAFADAWKLGQRADYAISFSIVYAVIANTRYDASPGFRGNHQLVLSGGLVYDPLADGRRAGIPTSPEKWPKDLLRRAAGKYASMGEGRAAVIVARAPAIQPKRYSVLFEPGTFWVYPVTGGRVKDSFSKKTSAPCSAPFLLPWVGKTKKRVVEITGGRLAGKRVEPTATHLALREAK